MNDNPNYVRIPAGRPVELSSISENSTHMVLNNDLLHGTLHGEIQVLTPVHVGSGDLEMVRNLAPEPENPEHVPLVAEFFRAEFESKPVLTIPGSSLKGAFRHLFELITFSCFAQANRNPRRGGFNVDQDLRACRFRPDRVHNELCPACRVFGGQGYLGQVFFRPSRMQAGQQGRIEFVPQRWAPKVNARNAAKRKLYTHDRSSEDRIEPVETLSPGATLKLEVDFRNLTQAELGLLLIVLGQDNDAPIYPKLGGVKAHGFGAVQITLDRLERLSLLNSYLQYDNTPSVEGPDQVNAYVEAAKSSSAFFNSGWTELVKALGRRPGGTS